MLLSYTIVKNVYIERTRTSNFMSAGRIIMNNKIKQAAKLTLFIGLGIVFSGNASADQYATKANLDKEITDRKAADTKEIALRSAADGKEASDRAAAVSTEANTRSGADTTEIGLRSAADTALGQRIDNIPAGKQGDQGIQGIQGDPGTGPVGGAEGDMQYWHIGAWVNIPVAVNNSVLRNCDGIPTWVADHCAFQIGDRGPAGGWVFYITDAGQHGLEAAPVDQAPAPWGCYGTVVGGTSSDLGTGLANTTTINAKCGFGTAAYNAANYSSNGLGGWYLPSKDELNQMYLNIGQGATTPNTNVGGFADYGYWSSTETSNIRAWRQGFGNGLQSSFEKLTPSIRVRAVRAF